MSKERFCIQITLVMLLAGCAPNMSAIDFYDNCARQNSSFLDMSRCGKLNRNNYCAAHNTCSADGNAFVLYTDTLEKSVENHEMSEAEAQREWVEFRAAQINAARQRAATLAAQIPTTCYTNNGVTTCY
jgi:hypothetical protein